MPTTNGKEQVFNFGIKNNDLRPADTSADFLVTQNDDGTQGKIDPLNLPISNYANTRMDGIDLSIANLEYDKLDKSEYNDRFKGKYTSLASLESAHPAASPGDYAQVDAGVGSDVINYNWDSEDGWIEGGSGSSATDTDMLPEGSVNRYFTTARVLATLLSGISFATGGAIVSTDSVLVAFGKLQNQLTNGFTGSNIRSLLGITTLSGTNTGDETASTIATALGYVPANKTDTISYALSDPYNSLITGDTDTMQAPYNFTLISYWVAVKTAPTLSSLIVDVKKNGTSITSTKAGIDATEKTSLTGTSPVLTTTFFVKGDEITPNIFQVGSGESGRSLKLYLEILKTKN